MSFSESPVADIYQQTYEKIDDLEYSVAMPDQIPNALCDMT